MQTLRTSHFARDDAGYATGQRPWDGSLGAFALKTPALLQEDLAWLTHHPVLSKFLPWGNRGTLEPPVCGRA